MRVSLDDTICAIASAPGGAARGIVRISGLDTVAALKRCFAAAGGVELTGVKWPSAIPGELALSAPFAALPCELYLWPGRRSYTRQPSAELHTIGSPPLLEVVLQTVCAAGARLAEPGEFTLRAFLAGRLDLTQAEAVLGVIDAHSRRELDVALAQLAGGLATPLHAIRNQLLDLLAHLEAGLDFVEEDIEFISAAELDRQLAAAATAVHAAAEQMTARGETPDAWRVALAGWPNVGKSSLLNALAGEPAALVSDTPGTTRDYLRRRIAWDRFHVELLDTAGVAPAAADAISAAAQSMSAEQVGKAHLVLLCLDASRPLNDWEREQLAPLTADSQSVPPHLVVLTKADLPRCLDLPVPHVAVSSATGAGLDALRRRIEETIAENYQETAVVAGTAIRCRESLRLASESLARARQAAVAQIGEELVAAEIRTALDELGKVAGQVYTDDVLDRIFSRFCIGN
jgi:tRNA modification GTPase